MADRKHLLHVRSSETEKNEQYGINDFLVTPKKPVDLLYGEIAVNYGKGVEALTIRNTEDDIVAFVNENDFNEAGEITAAGLATEKMEREEVFNQLNNKIDSLEVSGMVSTTYAEIKGLREQSNLKPGQFYRITDYVTTTVQSNTQSAGHAFDVIVRADSESVLNENSFAIQHAGDTYFANQKLSAWELKYDINNDTTKYAWADATNGKGVIYYMKDENDNECPYDFKNIQFKVGAKQQAGTVADVFYFTFSVAKGANDADVTDHSLNGGYCYGNKMGPYILSRKHSLNTNVFRNTSVNECFNNKFGRDCFNNTFGRSCFKTTFGNYCHDNTIGWDSNSNIFGNNCNNNTFENTCISNIFGNNCTFNVFGYNCQRNTFGNYCSNNTIGNSCTFNTFGKSCTFNTFGNTYSSNIFGNNCGSNIFGNNCGNNIFGNYCSNNTIGNSCISNVFGNNCQRNKFGTASAAKDYYKDIIFENGVQYVLLDCTQTTSSSAYCQNVLVGMGITGTSSNKKTLTVATAGNAFKTTFKTANDVEVTV